MLLRFACNLDLGDDGLWSGSLYLRAEGSQHAGTLDRASDAELKQALEQASKYVESIWPEKPPAEVERLLTLLD